MESRRATMPWWRYVGLGVGLLLLPAFATIAGLGFFFGGLSTLYGTFGPGGSKIALGGLVALVIASLAALLAYAIFRRRRQLVRAQRIVVGLWIIPMIAGLAWFFTGPAGPNLSRANLLVAAVYSLYGLALAFEASQDHSDI
jgi:hypothetical protein